MFCSVILVCPCFQVSGPLPRLSCVKVSFAASRYLSMWHVLVFYMWVDLGLQQYYYDRTGVAWWQESGMSRSLAIWLSRENTEISNTKSRDAVSRQDHGSEPFRREIGLCLFSFVKFTENRTAKHNYLSDINWKLKM